MYMCSRWTLWRRINVFGHVPAWHHAMDFYCAPVPNVLAFAIYSNVFAHVSGCSVLSVLYTYCTLHPGTWSEIPPNPCAKCIINYHPIIHYGRSETLELQIYSWSINIYSATRVLGALLESASNDTGRTVGLVRSDFRSSAPETIYTIVTGKEKWSNNASRYLVINSKVNGFQRYRRNILSI